MSTKEYYDVVVVGAGISGLLSALAISKEGKKVPALEKYMDMIHYQDLVPEKATWSINAGFGDMVTPIENMFCIGSDSYKRSMELTHASYSVLKMLNNMGV